VISASHGKEFIFHDGSRAKTLSELLIKIEHLSDHEFHHFVNHSKNDFANWIEHVLEDKTFASKLRLLSSRNEIVRFIRDRVEEINSENYDTSNIISLDDSSNDNSDNNLIDAPDFFHQKYNYSGVSVDNVNNSSDSAADRKKHDHSEHHAKHMEYAEEHIKEHPDHENKNHDSKDIEALHSEVIAELRSGKHHVEHDAAHETDLAQEDIHLNHETIETSAEHHNTHHVAEHHHEHHDSEHQEHQQEHIGKHENVSIKDTSVKDVSEEDAGNTSEKHVSFGTSDTHTSSMDLPKTLLDSPRDYALISNVENNHGKSNESKLKRHWFQVFSKNGISESNLEKLALTEEDKSYAERELEEELAQDRRENSLWIILYFSLVLLIITLLVYKLFL
jgi:hypothetical protein